MHGPDGAQAGDPSQVQLPLVQPLATPESHACPHAPQLFTSLPVLMQFAVQHCWLPLQVRPHAPQLPTLVWMSTHSPPQQRKPAAQGPPEPQWQAPPVQLSPTLQLGSQGTSAVQVPAMQTWPLGQTIPHAPQLFVSLSTSMQWSSQQAAPAAQWPPVPHWQVPPEHVSPGAQAGSQGMSWQVPAAHIWPASQWFPQPPQASESLATSTHEPSQQMSVPVQAGPPPHLHSPLMHTFAVTSQALPQVPQSVSELSLFTQAPSQHARPPSQPVSGVQPATHDVPRQIVPDGQVIEHPPCPPSTSIVGMPASCSGCEASGAGTGPESIPPLAPPCAHPAAPNAAKNKPVRR